MWKWDIFCWLYQIIMTTPRTVIIRLWWKLRFTRYRKINIHSQEETQAPTASGEAWCKWRQIAGNTISCNNNSESNLGCQMTMFRNDGDSKRLRRWQCYHYSCHGTVTNASSNAWGGLFKVRVTRGRTGLRNDEANLILSTATTLLKAKERRDN